MKRKSVYAFWAKGREGQMVCLFPFPQRDGTNDKKFTEGVHIALQIEELAVNTIALDIQNASFKCCRKKSNIESLFKQTG